MRVSMIDTVFAAFKGLCSFEAAEVAVELGSGSIFNIKPSRCGGVTQALRIMKLAHANGIVCWIGGMLESGIGVQFCKALASKTDHHQH